MVILSLRWPKVSEDGLTYTFKLREAKYSDGTPVRAQDFVYAFQNVVDPKTTSSSSHRMDIFKNGEKFVMVNYLLTN